MPLGRRQRRDRGRTDVLRRIQIRFHQRRVGKARMLLQDGLCRGCSLRINRAPAGKIARQDFEREQRGCDLREALVGFLGASSGRGLSEKLTKLAMGFDERTEPGLPQYIRQTAIAVQVMVALDQASALTAQVLRQKAEIGTAAAVRKRLVTCAHRRLCHPVHRFAPRPATNSVQRDGA